MIRPLFQYVFKECIPRWKGIIISWETFFALIGLVYVTQIKIDGNINLAWIDILLNPILTYATISLGFCIAGMSIIFSNSNGNLLKKLVETHLSSKKNDAFSELLFVFSWTALLHWLLIVYLLSLLALYKFFILNKTVFTSILAFITIYCICQFFIVLITIFQFGKVYIDDLKNTKK